MVRFRIRRQGWSARRVVVAVVAACVLVSVGTSTASAVTASSSSVGTCKGKTYSSAEALAACILVLARSADLQPKDMKVAAPSSVIAATSSSIQEVNNWRPNTQAIIDAKARLAATSGVTSADVASASRWKPTLARAGGVIGGALLANDLAWWASDQFLYPALGVTVKDKQDLLCMRYGNFATDFITGMFTGTECGDWRLAQDYESLVGDLIPEILGEVWGLRYAFRAGNGNWCYEIMDPFNPEYDSRGTGVWYWPHYTTAQPLAIAAKAIDPADAHYPNGLRRVVLTHPFITGHGLGGLYHNTGNRCGTASQSGSIPQVRVTATDNSNFLSPALYLIDQQSGDILEQMTEGFKGENAEWVTRVRCLDGSYRTSVSDSFQQEKLGAVAVPEAVALDGCQPVGVDIGLQKEGTGLTADVGDPWATEPTDDKTRTQVGTGEVPVEVQDWMQDFPSCWDGSCMLELKKVVGDVELDCFEVPDQCVNWFEESKLQPQKYKCYYGGQARALSECFLYARVFDRTNVQDGTGYADPSTGEDVLTDSKTGIGSEVAVSNPGGALVVMGDPVGDPSQPRECWPSGWAAFNPFEWVLQPVKCALEWAFVPRTSVLQSTLDGVKLTATNSKPAQFVQGLNGWAAAVPSSATCTGPPVNLTLPFNATYSGYPLSACEAPRSTLASVSRAFLTFVFAAFGMFAITRYAGAVFGFRGFGRNGGQGDS